MDGIKISKAVKWVFIITFIAVIINSGWIYSLFLKRSELVLGNRINELINEKILLQNKVNSLNKQLRATVKYSLECLTENDINIIRNNPIAINDVFLSCETELSNKTESIIPFESNSSLNQNDQYLIFTTIVANRLAPYGDTPHFSKIEDLLNAHTLDCSGYTLLVGYFATLREESLADIDIHFVGWQSSAIANHAQIFIYDHQSGITLLLDPTIALIAVTTFDQVASGIPINPNNIADFSIRKTPFSIDTQNQRITFSKVVINVLTRGQIKPSDLLYYYENLQHYLGTSIYKDNFITPGGVTWRHINHPEYYDLDTKK